MHEAFVWRRPTIRYWSASREPQRSMTSRGYDPRQSPGLGIQAGPAEEVRMSPFEWWAAHPWRVWWASYVPALGGAFLAQTLEKTGMILFGLGMVVWSASFIQGLRVTWHRSRKKAATIFGLMFLGALANPISRGVSGRDFAKLDSAI